MAAHLVVLNKTDLMNGNKETVRSRLKELV